MEINERRIQGSWNYSFILYFRGEIILEAKRKSVLARRLFSDDYRYRDVCLFFFFWEFCKKVIYYSHLTITCTRDIERERIK